MILNFSRMETVRLARCTVYITMCGEARTCSLAMSTLIFYVYNRACLGSQIALLLS